jgi:hypothetical protein
LSILLSAPRLSCSKTDAPLNNRRKYFDSPEYQRVAGIFRQRRKLHLRKQHCPQLVRFNCHGCTFPKATTSTCIRSIKKSRARRQRLSGLGGTRNRADTMPVR